MAFNPLLPVDNSLIAAPELRSQFTGLKDEIDTLAADSVTQSQHANDLVNTQNAAVNTVLPMTSANTNGVALLGITANTSYDPAEMQIIINKLDEFINAARR